jgi:hypothetical protein
MVRAVLEKRIDQVAVRAVQLDTVEARPLRVLRTGSQPLEALWNPPGYMRNVVESVRVTAA